MRAPHSRTLCVSVLSQCSPVSLVRGARVLARTAFGLQPRWRHLQDLARERALDHVHAAALDGVGDRSGELIAGAEARAVGSVGLGEPGEAGAVQVDPDAAAAAEAILVQLQRAIRA